LTGDLNCAHNEIDIHNPKTNKKSAGFTLEERESFGKMLLNGFTDVFRHLYPDEKDCYTYWSHKFQSRAKGNGWRLDYFIVSNNVLPRIVDSYIGSELNTAYQRQSDHAPIFLQVIYNYE
jgi:exodeoxyribonuclease III